MRKRILVTGSTGFIGAWVVKALLAEGLEVHATYHFRLLQSDAAIWHQVDLFEREQCNSLVKAVQPELLLHLGWYAVHGLFWSSAENLRWLSASLDLIRAFRDAGGQRVVVAGSCAEYAWTTDAPMQETMTPLEPSTLYGVSKDSLRRAVAAYCSVTGLSWAWGRIFFPYGEGEAPTRFIPSVAAALVRGEIAPCGNGDLRRDFLHVEDIARALAALVSSGLQGPVNIGSGNATALREVAEQLRFLVGGNGGCKWGALPTRKDDPPTIVADIRRLKDDLGFEPTIDLISGLRRVVARAWDDKGS